MIRRRYVLWLLSGVSLFALTTGMEAARAAAPNAIFIPTATYQPGSQSWTLRNVQGEGFEAVFTPPSEWPSGELFDISIQLSFDGATFSDWITAPQTSDGTHASPFHAGGSWPGVNDGSGGRQTLYPSAIRATITVYQKVKMSVAVTPR